MGHCRDKRGRNAGVLVGVRLIVTDEVIERRMVVALDPVVIERNDAREGRRSSGVRYRCSAAYGHREALLSRSWCGRGSWGWGRRCSPAARSAKAKQFHDCAARLIAALRIGV